MSLFLNGKIAKILTRLGTPASSDIATKVDELHDVRLTAARAALLDKMLDNTVWTSAKAAFLDKKISETGIAPPIASGLKGRVISNADLVNFFGKLAAIPEVKVSTGTANTWVSVLSVTGAGIIEYLNFYQTANASDQTIQIRLSVDGAVVYLSDTNIFQVAADNNTGVNLVGFYTYRTTDDPPILSAIPFNTSFALEMKRTIAGAGPTIEVATRPLYYMTG